MAWWIGVDEAGYGPNLGPFVMTAAACRYTGERPNDLWQTLAKASRKRSANDDRLFVADSKQVFSQTKGLAEVEKTVFAVGDGLCEALDGLVASLCVAGGPPLTDEIWYTGKTTLPTSIGVEVIGRARDLFRETSRSRGLEWGPVWSIVVCPREFNTILDRYTSKGAVLAMCLAKLLKTACSATNGESVSFFIDKHGGRNQYAPMLQAAFDDGYVVGRVESAARSAYDVAGLDRTIDVTIEPRADSRHFCVALASLFSKYVRELLMMEFNQYWRNHLPALKPTAGYPVDAMRYFKEIQTVMEKLAVPVESIWRRK